jgi:hypothetical protein
MGMGGYRLRRVDGFLSWDCTLLIVPPPSRLGADEQDSDHRSIDQSSCIVFGLKGGRYC